MKNIALNSQNPAMTTCLISAFFLGTSATQAIAAVADKVEQCPSAVPEPVCQPDPKTMQQHIQRGGDTSGRGKSKNDSESHAELNVQV